MFCSDSDKWKWEKEGLESKNVTFYLHYTGGSNPTHLNIFASREDIDIFLQINEENPQKGKLFIGFL